MVRLQLNQTYFVQCKNFLYGSSLTAGLKACSTLYRQTVLSLFAERIP